MDTLATPNQISDIIDQNRLSVTNQTTSQTINNLTTKPEYMEETPKQTRKAGRPKGKQYKPSISAQKGYLIGKELAKGLKTLDAVRTAGYNVQSSSTACKIAKYTHARDWADHFLANKATTILENLTDSATVDKTPQILQALSEGDTATARVLVDLLKISHKAGQDLLDRAGISKISKSMHVSSKVNYKDNESISKRINELKAKLDTHSPRQVGRKPITITGEVVDNTHTPSQAAPLVTDCTDTSQVDISTHHKESINTGATEANLGVESHEDNEPRIEIFGGVGAGVDVSHTSINCPESEKGGRDNFLGENV